LERAFAIMGTVYSLEGARGAEGVSVV